jgi:putative PIN family toxin of toxin-antitoxin system
VIRAVLDTHVYVAALLTPRGAPALLLRRWLDGAFDVVVCRRLLDELGQALDRPAIAERVPRTEAARFLASLNLGGVMRDDPRPEGSWSRDPTDDYLVDLGRQAGAHVLVTGDRDLLALEGAMVVVRSPRAFLDELDSLGPA